MRMLWIILLTILGHVLAMCPDSCTCSAKSVVCSCNDTPGAQKGQLTGSRLELTPFKGRIDFTNILVVHSCDYVVLPNDTFNGVDILDQIKFMQIGQLEIKGHAFRGIKTSPRQIVIQDTHLPFIQSNAFAGLNGMDHFWLRNVSIGRIQKMAFLNVSNVQYIYFRSSSIASIDPGAFAHMQNITYFYMKEKILIKTMADFVFVGSTISELLIEKANIHSTDLTFVGLHASEVQMKNIKMNVKKTNALKRIPSQSIERFIVEGSVINRVVLALYYNTSLLSFDRVKISHFQGNPNLVVQNITTMVIKQSMITHWHSHTISSARSLNNLVIDSSTVTTIHDHAIYASSIDSAMFINTNIDTIKSKAFTRNDMREFIFDGSVIESMENNLFFESLIDNFTINGCKISELKEEAFAHFNSSLLSIYDSALSSFPDSTFKGLIVDDLLIKNCNFTGAVGGKVFNEVSANHLSVTDSSFNCQNASCEFNALILQSSIHLIAWIFERNQCHQKDVCEKETETDLHYGMICRKKEMIEECICANNTADLVYFPSPDVSLVIIGDCQQLRVVSSESITPTLQIMYLYRIASLEMVSVDPTLTQLHILHSRVSFSQPYGFSKLQLYQFEIVGSFVENIGPLSFVDSSIDYLRLNTSTVTAVSGNAFSQSNLHNVDFRQTEIYSVGNLLEHTKELTSQNSVIYDVRGMENISELCLTNNSMNCNCYVNIPHQHILCDSPMSQCLPKESIPIFRNLNDCKARSASLERESAKASSFLAPNLFFVFLITFWH